MNQDSISREAVLQVLKDYGREYKKHLTLSFTAALLPAIGSIFVFFVPPLIIAELVNLIVAGEKISLTSVGGLIVLFGGTWILGEALWRVGIFSLTRLEAHGMSSLGNEAFRRLIARDYDFYTNHFVGSLTKQTFAFSRGFEVFTDTVVFNIITNLFPLIFALVVLAQYSLWIPALLLVCIVLVLLTAIPIIHRRSKLVALRHAASSKVSGTLSDDITNILAVKSFASEGREASLYNEDFADFIRKFKRASDYQNLRVEMVLSPLYVITNVIGLIAAVYFTEHFGLEAGALVVIFSYYSQVTRAFWEINHVYRNIESSISEASEFTQLMLLPPTIRDAPGAQPLTLAAGNIVFKDVSFRYGGTKEGGLFLDQFNLEIRAGERVGLVGPSGGGKTTITKLLLRFIDPESGSILIGDRDIQAATQASLREIVSYVPQEPLLFHRSLFENIAYGRQGATEAEVVHAAKLAHAHEFIQELPQRYETLVGERGIKLSGGQRQRIAIARAILKNAPLLVLDEATSSLDSESEKYIQEGLWELMKDKTAIVIAHRLSTIKHLDRIIVLENGKVIQSGTHEQLVNLDGLYARLWSHQSGGFLEE